MIANDEEDKSPSLGGFSLDDVVEPAEAEAVILPFGRASGAGAARARPAAALLDDLTAVIRRYAVVTIEQAIAVALWTVYTWLHKREAFATHSAIIHVWGAEAESGKSTLASVVAWLVCQPLKVIEPTPAVLFRAIQKWSPTVILDEADDILAKSSELRSIINGAWTRGEQVLRCAPKTFEPQSFELFTPKMVVTKGRSLPGTTASRTIALR